MAPIEMIVSACVVGLEGSGADDPGMGTSAEYPPRPTVTVHSVRLTAAAEPAGDFDDDPKNLAQAVDEALDACATAWADGRMDTAKALLTSAMATVDALLSALGVSDPDES
jgi:hypothetical protein